MDCISQDVFLWLQGHRLGGFGEVVGLDSHASSGDSLIFVMTPFKTTQQIFSRVNSQYPSLQKMHFMVIKAVKIKQQINKRQINKTRQQIMEKNIRI